MKKLCLLLALSAGVSTLATAQNCKGIDEKKDSFTGKAVKSATVEVGSGGTRWLVDMDQSDGITQTKWGIAMIGEFNQQLPTGSVMMLKQADGTVMSMKTVELTSPVTQAQKIGTTVHIFTTYSLKFNLSKNELTNLSKSPITDLKIEITGANVENPKLKESQTEKIMNAAGCMLATSS